jgi:hypothetical protein
LQLQEVRYIVCNLQVVYRRRQFSVACTPICIDIGLTDALLVVLAVFFDAKSSLGSGKAVRSKEQ